MKTCRYCLYKDGCSGEDKDCLTNNESNSDRGAATRMKDYKEVYHQTGNHKLAIQEYCSGNNWLIENAKAVGNW